MLVLDSRWACLDVRIIVWFLFAHWVADFVLQTNWMAINKSKDNVALSVHCYTYAGVMTAFFGVFLMHTYEASEAFGNLWLLSFKFFCIMFATHYMVDYATSRINARLFAKWFNYIVPIEDRKPNEEIPTLHNFFVSVGFDQLLHFITIIWVCKLLKVF